jgi:hypothetical protein
MGFSALAYSDILAYFVLHRMPVEPSEVALIVLFDSVVEKVAAKKQKDAEKDKAPETVISE